MSGEDTSDGALARGIAWTAGLRWTSQLLTWLATLVVARLLTPADYGLVGMALVYTGLVQLVNEFGLGSSIVILRDLRRDQVAALNSVAVLIGLSAFGLSCALAAPIGAFYGAPEVPAIVAALSLAFVISGFQTVPLALLNRELRFKEIAAIDLVRSLSNASVTLVLAWLGHGYWSLVIGSLAGVGLATVVCLTRRAHAFAVPRGVRRALHVSSQIVVSRLAWYAYSNADYLVAGKVLGKAALGYYTFGFTIGSKPVELIAAMVSTVTPGFFSAVQSDRPALRRYFLRLTEGLALVSFPVAWGMALVADAFVPLALGDSWQGAVAPLRLLACYAAFRCITPLLAHVLNVTGQTRFGMWIAVLSATVLPAGFVLGSRWGTIGLAGAWLVLHPLVTLPNYVRVFRTLELSAADYARSLWPALSASSVMALGVIALDRALGPDAGHALRLAAEVPVGALLYAGTLGLFHRDRVMASLDAVRRAREKSSA